MRKTAAKNISRQRPQPKVALRSSVVFPICLSNIWYRNSMQDVVDSKSSHTYGSFDALFTPSFNALLILCTIIWKQDFPLDIFQQLFQRRVVESRRGTHSFGKRLRLLGGNEDNEMCLVCGLRWQWTCSKLS
jgi:hypothetical protein